MPQEPGGTRGLRVECTVFPETETLVSIQTIPEAVCFLYHDKAGRRLQLDADDRGIVRFHVKASKDAQPIELYLEYPGEGPAKTVQTLKLSSDLHHPPAAEATTVNNVPSDGEELRPPLEGDPLALSNQELLTRGYPPRPDPMMAPALYARWYKLVSQPFAVANPRKVPHPEVSFRQRGLPPKLRSHSLTLPAPVGRAMFNSSSNNWSGAYYTNPSSQFYQIQADWTVPPLIPAPPNGPEYAAAAEWIGLDNSATDLYQAGTDSEIIDLGGNWIATNYWMWIELLPFAPWAVPNVPVSPGDTVSATIWVADQYGTTLFNDGDSGGLTSANNSVWFLLYNLTQRTVYLGTEPTAPETGGGLSSSGFTGSTAEFILERPADGTGNPVPLTNFSFVTKMYGCAIADSWFGINPPILLGAEGSEPSDESTLTYLNMVDESNNDLLALAVGVPDSTHPGAYAIMWLWSHWQ